MNKKKVLFLLLAVDLIAVLVAAVVYFSYAESKPEVALYGAMAGGLMGLNLIMTIFFVNKNFKENK